MEGLDNHHKNISIAKTVVEGFTHAWINKHCNQKNLVRPGYVVMSVLRLFVGGIHVCSPD